MNAANVGRESKLATLKGYSDFQKIIVPTEGTAFEQRRELLRLFVDSLEVTHPMVPMCEREVYAEVTADELSVMLRFDG